MEIINAKKKDNWIPFTFSTTCKYKRSYLPTVMIVEYNFHAGLAFAFSVPPVWVEIPFRLRLQKPDLTFMMSMSKKIRLRKW